MKRYGLTTEHVIGRFEIGQEGGTSAAQVPGGRRLESVRDPGTGDMLLYSYRTIVAARRKDTGRIALTPRRYSVTTSKVMGKVRRLLEARGYVETGETQEISAAVPGRWGGYGPAWHATGVETLLFPVYARQSTLAMEAVDGTHAIEPSQAEKDRRMALAREAVASDPTLGGLFDRPFGERDGLPTGAR